MLFTWLSSALRFVMAYWIKLLTSFDLLKSALFKRSLISFFTYNSFWELSIWLSEKLWSIYKHSTCFLARFWIFDTHAGIESASSSRS